MLFSFLSRHTLTGVWVEIIATMYSYFSPSHTLTGVWVEIPNPDGTDVFRLVTPSRVCELKFSWWVIFLQGVRHTLTGVWVEMDIIQLRISVGKSHPHGCVSWNYIRLWAYCQMVLSHPHGCVSWNLRSPPLWWYSLTSHPHGCVSWNLLWYIRESRTSSHPHGCVSWNICKYHI